MDKLIHSLEDILSYKKPIKFIMPGHGIPLPNPDLTIPAAYFKRLGQVVKEAKEQGKSMAEAEEMFKNDTELAKLTEKFSSAHQANLSILWNAHGSEARRSLSVHAMGEFFNGFFHGFLIPEMDTKVS